MSDEQYSNPSDPYAHHRATPHGSAGDAPEWSVSSFGSATTAHWDMSAFNQYSQQQHPMSPAYPPDMTSNWSYSGPVSGHHLSPSPSHYRPLRPAPSPGLSDNDHPSYGLYSAPDSASIRAPQRSQSVSETAMVPTGPQSSMTRLSPAQAGLAGPLSPGHQRRRSSNQSSPTRSRRTPGVQRSPRRPTRRQAISALTMENLALLDGAGAEEGESITSRADVSASSQTVVPRWNHDARRRLTDAALDFINGLRWMTPGEKDHLKDLIATMPQSLAGSVRNPGQVGSLFTTRHPYGPGGQYEWKFSDAPGNEFRSADHLTEAHSSLGSTPEAQWTARATLHHGAIAIVTFAVYSIASQPCDRPTRDWVQSCVAQINDGARGVCHAAQVAMSRWSTPQAWTNFDGTQETTTLETRAWWFGAEHQDERYGTQGNRPAWVVSDSLGNKQESSAQPPVSRSSVQQERLMLMEPQVPQAMPWQR